MDTRSAAGSQTKGRGELALLESGLRPHTVDDCLCELLRATAPGTARKNTRKWENQTSFPGVVIFCLEMLDFG